MVTGKFAGKKIQSVILLLLVFVTTQCSNPAPNLPKDVLGISVGMSKDDAQKRLTEIAEFERNEEKNQQVWKLKNDSHFSELAVGYNKENQVRYITLFVDQAMAKERIRFADVADLSKARSEIVKPHYRYIWEVPASDGKPAYQVNIYGDNQEFVTIYSLSKSIAPDEVKEEDEDE